MRSALGREYWVLAAEANKIPVQDPNVRMLLPFAEVEFAAFEGAAVTGIGQVGAAGRPAETVKLPQKLLPPLAHQFGQIDLVVGKVKKRRGSGEFLALKEHWGAGSEQEQGRQRTVAPGEVSKCIRRPCAELAIWS